jgi:5'-3' exonuclease/transcription antitermination factor NusG
MTQELLWVVLELTSKAEGEDPDIIRSSIRHHIKDAEVFIPASVVQRGPVREYHYLVDGYAFVKHRHPDHFYSRLEDTKFVQSPLYVSSGTKKDRRLATVTQQHIDKFRSQITVEVDQGIEVGDTVMITSGPYKNIKAAVTEEISEQDHVVVHIKLRSTDRLVSLPRAFLRLESKSPVIKYKDRFNRLLGWTSLAKQLVGWPSELSLLDQAYKQYSGLEGWVNRSATIYQALKAYYQEVSLSDLLERYGSFSSLSKGQQLRDQMESLSRFDLNALGSLTSKYQEAKHLSGYCSRILNIYKDVQNMTEGNLNLIVDGTQLLIRCMSAPGLGTLTDSQGRVTGPVVGFLRSLGSYRKRFPTADIYVCWDGSSQRRKDMFDGYKATRASRSSEPVFGWDWLRSALPLLGVHQAYNPREEADDVMASLVWGPLKESFCILVTSDRDLLQVVSESTQQLCPAVGAGSEKLYDSALVISEYGVPPESMVQLRALSGDNSDNIPGVPSFGLKTAAKALKAYGTVKDLMASNLAGMSKAQAANLRASAKQVALNMELMALRQVPITDIKSNPNQTEAEAQIRSLEIKPEGILQAFFPNKA